MNYKSLHIKLQRKETNLRIEEKLVIKNEMLISVKDY